LDGKERAAVLLRKGGGAIRYPSGREKLAFARWGSIYGRGGSIGSSDREGLKTFRVVSV